MQMVNQTYHIFHENIAKVPGDERNELMNHKVSTVSRVSPAGLLNQLKPVSQSSLLPLS